MRILIAECKQEVSTFNPAATHYEDFVTQWGGDILTFHDGLKSEVGGAMSVFKAAGAELTGAYSARTITSGGTLAAADWDRIANEFLAAIRKAPPVNAVFFSMHGAMCAANEVDPEGYLLTEARKILGDAIPI